MKDIEVFSYSGEGYKPLVDFESWRVAILNYCDELLPQNISSMQKHTLTDECFILLSGSFTLFTGGSRNSITDICATTLEPCKIYNVKKGVWHTHTLSLDARVLIVENRNTDNTNSPVYALDDQLKQQLLDCMENLTTVDT